VLAAVVACKISTDLNQPIAIEMILPDSGRVEVTDTFQPRAIALNAVGDSVQAEIFWASLDTAALQVLDSTTGASLAKSVASGARLQARTGRLLSNPQAVQVLAHLDSMAADSVTRDTLVDSLSMPLRIKTFATGGNAFGRRVIYALTTYPDTGSVVTLLPRDTVTTGGDGKASVQLRLQQGTRPDSVVVTAAMQQFHGGVLPGSPVTFVVEFRP
jgi:hypothetical protein